MAGRLYQYGVAASGLLLIAVLVLWPRSCFFVDQWRVRSVGPMQSPQPPQLLQTPIRTGYDPSGWSEDSAVASVRGLVIVSRTKSVASFFMGRIVTYRLSSLPRLYWLPMSDNFVGIGIPYWCIALAAAILPAIWLYRTREQREPRARFRFGVRGLLALTALCALALTGYVHLGGGGVILVVAAALAWYVGVVLLRRPTSSGRMSAFAQKVFGVALVCVALYQAYLLVDCYRYMRAWAPYNSMDT